MSFRAFRGVHILCNLKVTLTQSVMRRLCLKIRSILPFLISWFHEEKEKKTSVILFTYLWS